MDIFFVGEGDGFLFIVYDFQANKLTQESKYINMTPPPKQASSLCSSDLPPNKYIYLC